jgi:hypothetical protein
MKGNNRIVAAILTTGLLQQPLGEAEAAFHRDSGKRRDPDQAVELYRRVLKALRESKKARNRRSGGRDAKPSDTRVAAAYRTG